MDNFDKNRQFMKSDIENFDKKATADMANGIPQPAIEKTYDKNAVKITLPEIRDNLIFKKSFYDCTFDRCSRRNYTNTPLSIIELSFLLWCTQGIKKTIPGYRQYIKDGSGINILRPVAAGGAVPSYETYLVILNIDDLEKGVYRYLPTTHELLLIKTVNNIEQKLVQIFSNPSQEQSYTTKSGVVFFWACTPYRGEWRSKDHMHKVMLIDVGHIAQNLYLAVEAIDCGCCEIAGYYQKKADNLLEVDGNDEYTVLCASVGHINPEQKDVYKNIPVIRKEYMCISKK